MSCSELNSTPEMDALRRASNYPMAIGRALIAATDNALFMKVMPGSYLPVLFSLIKKMSVTSPSQAIFARRNTLAEESELSIETVGRTLRWLEEHDLITREKKTHAGLRGSTCQIKPTKKLTDMLGLNLRTSMPSKSGKPDMTKTAPTPAPSKKRHFVKVNGKSIPTELAWMVQQGGMVVTGLLRLMKLARASGKRLSDVVQVAYNYMIVLKGRELYSYAFSLIQQKKDFGYLANADRKAEEVRVQKTLETELVERKSFEWKGRTLKNRAGSHTYAIRENGSVDVTHDNRISVLCIDMKFIDAVNEGKLRFI